MKIILGSDPEQMMFVEVLGRLSNGLATHADWMWLARRSRMSIGEQQWNEQFVSRASLSLFSLTSFIIMIIIKAG